MSRSAAGLLSCHLRAGPTAADQLVVGPTKFALSFGEQVGSDFVLGIERRIRLPGRWWSAKAGTQAQRLKSLFSSSTFCERTLVALSLGFNPVGIHGPGIESPPKRLEGNRPLLCDGGAHRVLWFSRGTTAASTP